MSIRRVCVLVCMMAACVAGCATQRGSGAATGPVAWRGVHVFAPAREDLPVLKRAIAEALAPMGVNVLVFEVNYRFAYQSHPELVEPGKAPMTRDDARDLAAWCRQHGIRLIPQFNCLGHQSWGTGSSTLPLLVRYPEFDETPWVPADNKGIYCRSWCPLHPKVNEIVFALMDELIDAFQADAFHVGMDEVFLIADSQCPRCKGRNPAELYAKAVNDYHRHLVDEKRLTMLMWGDRLLDQAATGYSMWESSRNGTAPAIDLIPKDIIICDWHYGLRDDYPSVPYFQQKGFRVWPAPWNREDAALALLQHARAHADNGKMLGVLCTTWTDTGNFARAVLGEDDPAQRHKDLAGCVAALQACMEKAGGKR